MPEKDISHRSVNRPAYRFYIPENVRVMRIFAIEAGDLLDSAKLQYFFIFNKFLLYFTSKTCYSS